MIIQCLCIHTQCIYQSESAFNPKEREIKAPKKNNNNMIIFLTLVGACHQDRHNLPFLGWLINKNRWALRFIPLRRFASFRSFLVIRLSLLLLVLLLLLLLGFFSYFTSVFRRCFLLLSSLSPSLLVSVCRASVRAHRNAFHAVIISHFIVYLYHGARTLYFISWKWCSMWFIIWCMCLCCCFSVLFLIWHFFLTPFCST